MKQDKELYKKAYNAYISVCGLIEGMTFEDGYKYFEEFDYNVLNKNDERFDINFDVACLTINNVNGKCSVNDKSIEVYDGLDCLGNFTAEECANLGEVEE